MPDYLKKILSCLTRYFFCDEARLIEIFSIINLLAWAHILVQPPLSIDLAMFEFTTFKHVVWGCGFGVIATLQLLATFNSKWFSCDIRMIMLSIAAGAWAVVAFSFWAHGNSYIATLNYASLSLGCGISAGFLGWIIPHTNHERKPCRRDCCDGFFVDWLLFKNKELAEW